MLSSIVVHVQNNVAAGARSGGGDGLADAAVELPALLLYAFDAGHGLHASVINCADLRDPVHAGGMAPQPCLCGGL